MNHPKTILHSLLLALLLALSAQTASAQQRAALMHTVDSAGHPMALWQKSVANPKGHILLHHGRTWSSLPDFDLQVPGEELSLMDGFNERGYSVWALDARGYGQTPRDSSGWNTPEKAASDLLAVIDWLTRRNGEKPHVWGWSLGSMVVQLAAQRESNAMASATLFGYPVRTSRVYPQDENSNEPPREATTAEAAASDFIVPGSISSAAIAAYVAASLAADPVRADWNMTHQWNELDPAKLQIPTLLLQAELDPLADDSSHAELFLGIPNPNKQWVVLGGGDHAALLEKPRAKLIQASIDFIEWLATQ